MGKKLLKTHGKSHFFLRRDRSIALGNMVVFSLPFTLSIFTGKRTSLQDVLGPALASVSTQFSWEQQYQRKNDIPFLVRKGLPDLGQLWAHPGTEICVFFLHLWFVTIALFELHVHSAKLTIDSDMHCTYLERFFRQKIGRSSQTKKMPHVSQLYFLEAHTWKQQAQLRIHGHLD